MDGGQEVEKGRVQPCLLGGARFGQPAGTQEGLVVAHHATVNPGHDEEGGAHPVLVELHGQGSDGGKAGGGQDALDASLAGQVVDGEQPLPTRRQPGHEGLVIRRG